MLLCITFAKRQLSHYASYMQKGLLTLSVISVEMVDESLIVVKNILVRHYMSYLFGAGLTMCCCTQSLGIMCAEMVVESLGVIIVERVDKSL